jgi:Pyruvate/2-oxoacid:ferredoxin oxidoreductase delta subunit
MTIRQIISIDEDLCDGCGNCVPACAEGAIQVIDGKARLVSEVYCDGLGACLGECPQDALSIEEREVVAFDEEAVKEHLARDETREQRLPMLDPAPHVHGHGGCPGAAMRDLGPRSPLTPDPSPSQAASSELRNWPVQIKLVPIQAPYFEGADLLIAADCVPFAHPEFHRKYLRGRTLLVGCPKLDDAEFYRQKMTAIFQMQDIRSVEVAIMEVPCCTGMASLVKQAIADSGKAIPMTVRVIGIRGEEMSVDVARPVGRHLEDRV